MNVEADPEAEEWIWEEKCNKKAPPDLPVGEEPEKFLLCSFLEDAIRLI